MVDGLVNYGRAVLLVGPFEDLGIAGRFGSGNHVLGRELDNLLTAAGQRFFGRARLVRIAISNGHPRNGARCDL